MFKVLAHSDLFHQLVLVSVHSCQLAHVSEDVLKTIRQLERIHVVQTVLDVRIHDQLGEPQDLPAEMEGITETGFLALLGRESLHRFQIEVIIQMKVIQILAVDQQIQHVVSLPANLQANFNPIQ